MGPILWLASYPKSGNTWLRAFLANLIADRPEPVPLNELHCYTDEEAAAARFSQLAGRPNTELTTAELAALRPRVHALIAQQARGIRLVKTHNASGTLDGYPLFNWDVTAGAIYIVRNPLDVVVSVARHYHLSVETAIVRLADDTAVTPNNAFYVSHFLGSWSTHVRTWVEMARRSPKRILILRYEDLLAAPATQFRKVATLVGLDGDLARIERAARNASFASLSALETRGGFCEAADTETRFFFRGTAGQWRSTLSPTQVHRVWSHHHTQMTRFGYVPDLSC